MDTLTKLFDKRIQENIKLKRIIIEAANEKGFLVQTLMINYQKVLVEHYIIL
jgi:hypothetical protein